VKQQHATEIGLFSRLHCETATALDCIGIIAEFATLAHGETDAEALVRGHTKEKLSLR
jgi:hypothetical protein